MHRLAQPNANMTATIFAQFAGLLAAAGCWLQLLLLLPLLAACCTSPNLSFLNFIMHLIYK